jgi:Family of unknown function (DUF6941)
MSAVVAQAFLAESVAVAGGRLFVQGAGWANLHVPELPAYPSRIGAGVILQVPLDRAGEEIPLVLRLEGPDGEPVGIASQPNADVLVAAEVEGTLVPEPGPDGSPLEHQLVPIAFNLDGLRLEAAGVHTLVVEVDGERVVAVPFGVVLEA